MRITNTIIITTLLCLSNVCFSQEYLKNVFEFSYDVGFSNNLSSSEEVYTQLTLDFFVLLDNKNATITNNTTFSYTRFLGQRHGVKFLFERATYGFDFERLTMFTNLINTRTYRVTYLEFGISYVHKFPISYFTNFILEPGLRFHSGASSNSNLFIYYDKDSFSFSNYVGVEIPMAGNNFFVNFGLQIKLPLEKYNLDYDPNPPFKPFFVGFKVGANYQF